MNLLILGGTVFLGRHLVDAARQAGHNVTTFNRGNTRLAEQNDIERIFGDRTTEMHDLAGRKWDAVIDTCGYTPAVVSRSADLLKDSVEKYIFISTISVYQDFRVIGMDESAALRARAPHWEDDYGSLKAACEAEVERVFAENAVSVRAGLIVGPHDPTDRFTYWPARVSKGGRVIAPGDPEHQVQFVDARDLSEWTVRLAESAESSGPYNATGPDYRLTMEHFLAQCRNATGSDAEFIWINDTDLDRHKVGEFSELPLWLPKSSEDFRGFMSIDCSKAIRAGLRFRPLCDTVRDTAAWDAARDPGIKRKAGLSPEREAELLTSRQNS